jgi:hypothetical protein
MHDDASAATAVARAFAEAVNDGRHEDAATLLADNVELVFPGARLQGRDAWLASRRRQAPREHLREEVAIDEVRETSVGAEVSGRMIQRWIETGAVAGERPVRIAFAVDNGSITRLELAADD